MQLDFRAGGTPLLADMADRADTKVGSHVMTNETEHRHARS
jgi:hypothetical protein